MMHWWWESGTQLPWWGMVLGPIIMILVFAIGVLVAVAIVRAFGMPTGPIGSSKSALEVLQERFASGEIDRAEYEETRRLISGP